MKMQNRRPRAVWLLPVVVVLLVVTSAVLAQPSDGRIVGGQEADPGEWPWQVALVRKGADAFNGQFCGGSLITRDWVLTAAHCVDDAKPGDLDIIAGIHNLKTPDPNNRRVALTQIVVHPGWNSNTNDNDIALLKLASPVDARGPSGTTLPIAHVNLVAKNAGVLVGVNATVTGWGNTLAQPVPGGNSFPDTLYEVVVPIIANATCNTAYGNITDNMLCAGLQAGGKDSCQGDSGGPLVYFDTSENRWEQVGVVSFGIGCAAPNYPGVYARVSRYIDWINSYTKPFVGTNRAYIPGIFDVPPAPPPQPLVNGNFEQGPSAGWTEFSQQGWDIIVEGNVLPGSVTPHSGNWAAWLGGADDEISIISQHVTVPPAAPFLTYFHWIASADICGFDVARVLVNGTAARQYDLCSSNDTGGWQKVSVNLSAYAGQKVLLELMVLTDGSDNSNLFIDDVAFAAGAVAAGEVERGDAAGAAAPKGE